MANLIECNSKRARRICDGVDWISQLPDDLIVHILSFLPLKEAAATSLVSPRWSQLWRHTPNLIFQNDPDDDPEISRLIFQNDPDYDPDYDPLTNHSLRAIEWVNSVIHSHIAGSIKKLTISFYLHDFRFLTKWLRFALSRGVESLELNLQGADDVLDTSILEGIESSDYRSLKELRLTHLIVSGEAIELLVRHCPLLELLVLERVGLKSDLVVSGSLASDCRMSQRVCAPNLTRLRCDSDVMSLFLMSVFLESAPNLVEASICLRGWTMDRIAKNVAAKLEILTITLIHPKAFLVPQMRRLRKLVLDYSVVNTEFLLPVARLLQASPCLGEFSLKISDHKFAVFEVPERGASQHHHLNVFEFSGFNGGAADHIQLVKYIVDNCVALGEIVITPSPRVIAYPKRMHKILMSSEKPKDHRRRGNVVASEKRKAALRKQHTEQLLASKVPHNIKLLVV